MDTRPGLPLPIVGMKRAAKWVGIGFGVVVGLLVVTAGVVYAMSSARENAVFTPAPSSFVIPTDAASVAEGERLFHARGCADCHGEDAAGIVIMDEAPIGRFVSANLTYFASAEAQSWSAAVRDGLASDGTPLRMMPAVELTAMPDRELAAIVAYVRTLPLTPHELPTTTVGPIARLVDLMHGFPLFSANEVDHTARPEDIPPGRNPAMGAYIVDGCTGCHGATLSGGPVPGAPVEQMGIPPNLTFHETGLGRWTEADLRTALREGRTPEGTTLNDAFMPWETTFSRLTDEEIGAVYDHLRSVPHRPEGER